MAKQEKAATTKKKMKTGKKVLLIVLAVLVVAIAGSAVKIFSMLGYFNSGNSSDYELENVAVLPNSPLEGKNFIFLGSSVTDGMQAKGLSFVDYVSKRNASGYVKEAVSGTTLVNNGEKSYIPRMVNNISKTYAADGFICQLSTNDAQKGLPMGSIIESRNLEDFDTATIIGAMEYIIAYADETWNCPVMFYTGTKFDNAQYADMVQALYDLQDKWGIGIIDLWNNPNMQVLEGELYESYMNDPIHPTRRGYLEWWLPEMEKDMYSFFA